MWQHLQALFMLVALTALPIMAYITPIKNWSLPAIILSVLGMLFMSPEIINALQWLLHTKQEKTMPKELIRKVLIITRCTDCSCETCDVRVPAGDIPQQCPLYNAADMVLVPRNQEEPGSQYHRLNLNPIPNTKKHTGE
jgi:hypothetical protein